MQKIIKSTKYRLATQVLKELKTVIKPGAIEKLAYLKKLTGKIFFQPIPLSKNKLRERGFNQSLLIVNLFQNYFNFPIADFLIRTKETKTQAELKNKKERYINLRKAFRIKGNRNLIKDSEIILVDDVITTGITVSEAAKTLKKAGVKKIYVLALAKG